jgi:hypothetical protein
MFRARIRGRVMWSGDGDLHWVYLGNMKVWVEIGGGKKKILKQQQFSPSSPETKT